MSDSKINYLIFDMDGVLVDSSACHEAAHEKLWNKIGIKGPCYQEIAGMKTMDVVKRHTTKLHPTEKTVKQWVEFKQASARVEMQSNLKFYPDVDKVIESLFSQGWRMFVATGSSKNSVNLALEQLKVKKYFEFLITAEDVQRGKPDPEVFDKVVARAGISTKSSLVVEDSHSGVMAAISAGIQVCSVNSGVKVDDPLFLGAFSNIKQALNRLNILP